MKNTPDSSTYPDDEWEKGALGQSEAHVRKVAVEQEEVVEEGLGLQMISLRLQKDLIEELKVLAKKEGLGYQPYIRQLLSQHVRNRKKRHAA